MTKLLIFFRILSYYYGCCKLCMSGQLLSHVQLFAIPRTVACQTPLPLEFSRQEYWSGLPFPTPGDLPDPGIEPMSLMSPALAGGFFTTSNLESPLITVVGIKSPLEESGKASAESGLEQHYP